MLLVLTHTLVYGKTQDKEYERYPVYQGSDLGLQWSPQQSRFRIWAPTAEKAELRLYNKDSDRKPALALPMERAEGGTWTAQLKGNQLNKYYTFRVQIGGRWMHEVPDPYAKAAGVNGKKAMVVDLNATDPPGWSLDRSPALAAKTDAIIYELHIRDASISPASGIRQKGKYLGLTERDTKTKGGLSTGLDHIVELGVTHVHLLPFYDINSIDESRPQRAQYNWGYDPLNYNVPEGSYATRADNGYTRIREFKQLVKTFHEAGLRVVMDVVYNHTAHTENSNFNQLVPGYYYRQTAEGKFSNATACGNETASERAMMRKFILESMMYWAQEYHIDGFRIDLMGVHDIETMNLVSRELHRVRPDILLYGEGWTAGPSPLADSLRALKQYAYKLDRIAVFSDDIRDGIKGHVFSHEEKGFVSGKTGTEESIKFGIVAAVRHPQVNYSKVNYSSAPYAEDPYQTITYAECHDNHALWDRLALSASQATEEEREAMHKLALAIVLTSQGIPFLHAGTEFLRTKKGVENSFESPDSINQIDWNLKDVNRDVTAYVQHLIRLRKEHPAFRMRDGESIAAHLRFVEDMPAHVVAYIMDGAAVGDSWNKIMVLLNGSNEPITVPHPPGSWQVYGPVNHRSVFTQPSAIKLSPISCTILYQ